MWPKWHMLVCLAYKMCIWLAHQPNDICLNLFREKTNRENRNDMVKKWTHIINPNKTHNPLLASYQF